MIRNLDMSQVSDGKLYVPEDMVKAGCGNCEGCSQCCRGMGNSIVLDPYDAFRLEKGLGKSFQCLIGKFVELNAVDGLVLPNLKLSGEDESCGFLDNNGRCSIHMYRPGICRMFPLGRIFDNGGHKYFLQTNECPKAGVKVKVKKWIDVSDVPEYEKFTDEWHFFLRDVASFVAGCEKTTVINNVCTMLLNIFYMKNYNCDEEFYGQFYERLNYIRKYM